MGQGILGIPRNFRSAEDKNNFPCTLHSVNIPKFRKRRPFLHSRSSVSFIRLSSAGSPARKVSQIINWKQYDDKRRFLHHEEDTNMLSALKRDTVWPSRHGENYFITGSSVVVGGPQWIHSGYTVDKKKVRPLRERSGFSRVPSPFTARRKLHIERWFNDPPFWAWDGSL